MATLQPNCYAAPHPAVVNAALNQLTAALHRVEQADARLTARYGTAYNSDYEYHETVNQARRDALAPALPVTPPDGWTLPRRKDGKPVFECFRSSSGNNMRCPLMTMAVQAANRKCHKSGYELVLASLNFTVTQKQFKRYQTAAPERGKSVAYLVKEFIRKKLIKIDPEIHLLIILDTEQKQDHAHVHGYLVISPQKLGALNAAIDSARGIERQQSGRPYIETKYQSKDTRRDKSARYRRPIDVGFTGYMALHADKDTRCLEVEMCRKFTELLNDQYDREFARQQSTGCKPRQYQAHALNRLSQLGVDAQEKTVLREEFSYKLACDAQGNLVLRKWRSDEYYLWERNRKPGEPIPANMDFSGPETIPIEQRWLARNHGYKRSGGGSGGLSGAIRSGAYVYGPLLNSNSATAPYPTSQLPNIH